MTYGEIVDTEKKFGEARGRIANVRALTIDLSEYFGNPEHVVKLIEEAMYHIEKAQQEFQKKLNGMRNYELVQIKPYEESASDSGPVPDRAAIEEE